MLAEIVKSVACRVQGRIGRTRIRTEMVRGCGSFECRGGGVWRRGRWRSSRRGERQGAGGDARGKSNKTRLGNRQRGRPGTSLAVVDSPLRPCLACSWKMRPEPKKWLPARNRLQCGASSGPPAASSPGSQSHPFPAVFWTASAVPTQPPFASSSFGSSRKNLPLALFSKKAP